MLSEQLLADLHKLSRADKLRIVQTLVSDLANDVNIEAVLPTHISEAEIWSPLEAYDAARIMREELDEYKRHHGKS
jgi:hypothetical protein